MSQVSFHTVATQNAFSSLTSGSGSLTTGGLYFIEDTGAIMRATSATQAEQYGGRVTFVTSDFPSTSNAIQGMLYIKASTQTGKIYDGTNMVTVFEPATTVQVDSTITAGDTDAVSSVAVINYLEGRLAATASDATSDCNIPTINASTGKLDKSFLPDLALSQFLGTKTTLAGLQDYNSSAEVGDWAIVDGTTAADNGSYICTEAASTANSSTSSWQRLADKLDDVTTSITENDSTAVSSGAVFTALSWKTPSAG